jgi:beta-lactamase superfamily II metal-dependent hydrolase
MSKYAATCCFLDVGQGTSQVVLLGCHRAIIIDTGSSQSSTLINLLNKEKIERIEALILSHNDNDHIGNAASVFNRYQNKIQKITFFEIIRQSKKHKKRRINSILFGDRLKRQLKKGVLTASILFLWL